MGWWKKMFGDSIEKLEAKKTDPYYTPSVAVNRIDEEVSSSHTTVTVGDIPMVPASATITIKDDLSLPQKKPIKPLDLAKVKFVKAANQSNRRDSIRGICFHHIMMGSFKKNEEFLVSKASGVSAHYVLGRNAELTQMVNTKNKKAWHAGVSAFNIDGEERDNLNNCLIGIEIVNPGYVTKNQNSGKYWYNCGGEMTEWKGPEPTMATIVYPDGEALSGYSVQYPEKQLNKLVALCKALVEKYPQIEHILTHYEIAQPIRRKNDPFGLDIKKIKDMVFDGQG